MDRFAATCAVIARHPGRLKKVATLAGYLRTLDDADFARAVRFLATGPVLSRDGKRMSVGGATLREAALLATGWDPETYRSCHQAVGDSGETISLLMDGKTANEPLSLAEAEDIFKELFTSRRTQHKVDLLARTFTRLQPLTLRYFIKTITGNFRIGLLERMVEEAVAAATGNSYEAVRAANNSAGDIAAVALAARRGELHEIEARLFHPMDFMLARPIEQLPDLPDPTLFAVEDKYDGIRSQVHFDNGTVKIFTRGLEDVTHSYPEVVTAFQFVPGSGVVDGELLAWKSGRALPFNVFQQRLARKKLTPSLVAEIPVSFIAYDLLYRDGELLLQKPFRERRAALERLFAALPEPLLLSPQRVAASMDEVERLWIEARGRGNEGLILKRLDSIYEPSKRTGAWLKVKKPYGTLDVVVTAAEVGTGRRAIYLSDYTFGVKAGERYVNVGKAYSGLTDEEVKELTRILKSLSTDRFGRVILVQPQVVLEVAFDGVQKSPRHKSGFALRFPRIISWRKDKRPDEADTLETVQALYEASLAQGQPANAEVGQA